MAEEKKVDEEPKKSGSKLVLIIIIILLVLILVGGGIAAYFLLSDNAQPPVNNAPQTQARTNTQNRVTSRNSDLTQIGPVYPLDQFIVNLLSQNGSRFLKVKMDLELSDAKLTAELDKKKPLIRDIVIRTLTSKTYQEVSTGRGKEKLKDELVDRINSVLADGSIKNIYFTEFVVQ